MRIWRFFEPWDGTELWFAEAEYRRRPRTPLACPACGREPDKDSLPYLMTWEPDSDVIADFSWPGGAVVITEPVYRELEEHVPGVARGPVELIDDASRPWKRPKKRRVPFPYAGPPLVHVLSRRVVHVDRERSTAKLLKECAACGREWWAIDGVERPESRWSPETGLRSELLPRAPDQGLFVHERDLGGDCVFRVYESPGFLLCTDAAKSFIERRGFANVSFLEMGDVID